MSTLLHENVWSDIARTAAPLDVLALSVVRLLPAYTSELSLNPNPQTCKMTRNATHTRSVWIYILERVCDTYGILRSTYGAHTMSLESLVRAACRPAHWKRTLGRLVPGKPYPTFGGKIPQVSMPFHIPRGFYERFIDGGRFLFQACSNHPQNTLLYLWDLGVPGEPLAAPTLIASKYIGERRSHLSLSVCSTSDIILVSLVWPLDLSQVR
jgi:hypothetical protein